MSSVDLVNRYKMDIKENPEIVVMIISLKFSRINFLFPNKEVKNQAKNVLNMFNKFIITNIFLSFCPSRVILKLVIKKEVSLRKMSMIKYLFISISSLPIFYLVHSSLLFNVL